MTVTDAQTRSWAWVAAMKAYNYGGEPPCDPVEEAKNAYVAGELTIEAFEAKLTVIFSAERARR